jgi:hypothetical protein
MTIKNSLNILVALFVSTPLFAQANEELISEINDLSRAIRQATLETQATEQELKLARDSMFEALELIESSSGSNKACFDFAFEIYRHSTSDLNATDKALAACKIIADLKVAQYAYDIYRNSTSNANALDKATNGATRDQKGKLDIIQFAYEVYRHSTSDESALKAALTGVAHVKRGSIECVKEFYERYNDSTSNSNAMNKALESCSR